MKQQMTLDIAGMHCTSCALNIDLDLEDLTGVISVKTHFAKAQTKVIFEEEKISIEEIIGSIKKIGYEATY